MPAAVAAAVAADFVATAVADAVIFDLVAATTLDWVATYAVIQAGTSFVAGAVIRGALSGGAEDAPTSSPSFTMQAQARTHVIRSTVANRTIVYGRAMVSGPLVFAAASEDNQTLHLVIAIAGHELDAVEAIYFNDEAIGTRDGDGNVTSGTFSGYAQVIEHLGASDQAADAALVAAGVGWTTEHRGRGVAYLYAKLTWSRDIYPRGIPNIKALVRGKKLFDPRDASTAWSANWALACRDYLMSPSGLACTDEEVNDVAKAAAANVSDEAVTLADGSTEARYTCNGVIDTGNTPKSNMLALLSGGAGTLTWPGGVYTLHAGAYESPSVSLDEDDLRGAIRIRPRVGRQDLYNAVKGTFVDPDQSWQPIDFPALTNATYAAQDGGETIWHDVAYPVTTSSATAQRLAKIALEKSRQGITVEMPCKFTAFPISVWDTVQLSIDHLGWVDKEFKVTSWKLAESAGVDLLLQEESASCYTWSAEETTVDAAPDTALPNPFTVIAPGAPVVTETLYETTGSAGVKARATVSWVASSDVFVMDYLAEYRLAAGDWVKLPPTSGPLVTLDDLAPGLYEFRVRARNTIGVVSGYSGTRSKEILGLTAAPADVTGFTVIKSAGFGLAQWTLHPDLDVRIGGRIVIRHAPATSGAAWSDGVIVEEFNGDAINGIVPLMTGTYMAKAKDSTGNWSEAMVSFVATEGTVTGWTTVATSTQHAAFTGSKTNTVVSGSVLQIDTLGVDATGSYAFSAALDMTTVATRRFEADISAVSFLATDLIDSRTANIDTWSSIDGIEVNDCDVTLYAAITDDDPAGTPTWSAWMPFFVADFTCRAAKFKLDFSAGDPTHNIAVDTLVVHVKEPA